MELFVKPLKNVILFLRISLVHGVIGELETLLRFAILAGQAESWGRKKSSGNKG